MEHRIAAGVLVVRAGKLLMVRHARPNVYDFWVAPGGGVLGDEDLPTAAKREALEEAGILVEPLRLAYIEELTNPSVRQCKFWFFSEFIAGSPDPTGEEARRELIVEARFLSVEEFAGKTVFPPVLKDEFWEDLEKGFPEPKYLGVRPMNF